jgi:hypothetical protein
MELIEHLLLSNYEKPNKSKLETKLSLHKVTNFYFRLRPFGKKGSWDENILVLLLSHLIQSCNTLETDPSSSPSSFSQPSATPPSSGSSSILSGEKSGEAEPSSQPSSQASSQSSSQGKGGSGPLLEAVQNLRKSFKRKERKLSNIMPSTETLLVQLEEAALFHSETQKLIESE